MQYLISYATFHHQTMKNSQVKRLKGETIDDSKRLEIQNFRVLVRKSQHKHQEIL